MGEETALCLFLVPGHEASRDDTVHIDSKTKELLHLDTSIFVSTHFGTSYQDSTVNMGLTSTQRYTLKAHKSHSINLGSKSVTCLLPW